MTTATAPASTADSARSMARAAAPLITLGTTWVVRKAMMRGYEARTGRPAPVVYSRESSMMSKVLWAATMAATIALIEVVVWQIFESADD
jgi:hypothetical protein